VADRDTRKPPDEWRRLFDAVVASAASVAERRELPRDLLRVIRDQAALVQGVLEREQTLQRLIGSRVIEPVEAGFDLLEESAATLRHQAETLGSAAGALQETAELMAQQAELFERTIHTLRQPLALARSAAGVPRPPTRSAAGTAKAGRAKAGRAKAGRAKAAKPRGSAAAGRRPTDRSRRTRG
jgi:signal transduction histidine kinase